MRAIVKYKLVGYSGNIEVDCEEYEEDEVVVERARAVIIRLWGVPFQMVHGNWRVLKRF